MTPEQLRDRHFRAPACLPYNHDSKIDVYDALKIADRTRPGFLRLLYSDVSVPAGRQNLEFAGGAGWTREHVFPRSRWGGSTSIGIGTDLHNIFPADFSMNSSRGDKDFDDVIDGVAVYDNSPPQGGCRETQCRSSSRAWEPGDAAKGIVARSLLYVACMYCHSVAIVDCYTAPSSHSIGKLSAILRWNRAFPPSQYEIERNSAVEGLQGNRNPFTDHPELADALSFRI